MYHYTKNEKMKVSQIRTLYLQIYTPLNTYEARSFLTHIVIFNYEFVYSDV